MEIAIIKKETTGSGPNTFTDNVTIAKYEIMDGAPVRGESIPIRVFLAGYELTPTMRDINKKFSVRYFLNLVLMDTEDRRYFKQQEITLWRKGDKIRKPNLQSPAIMAGTQNLQNTAAVYGQVTHDNSNQNNSDSNDISQNDSEKSDKPPVKEDFLRSQSTDKLNNDVADPFDQANPSPTDRSPENQIQNMKREEGDGQNDTGIENVE